MLILTGIKTFLIYHLSSHVKKSKSSFEQKILVKNSTFCRLAMVDYGEFVPEALANSKDAILHALGQKMVLSPMCEVDPWTASWTYLVEEMMLRRKYALIETYSYLV